MHYTVPIEASRPPGAPHFVCWSPKLNRRVSLFSRWSFDQWVLLEATPKVQEFCERPYWLGEGQRRKLVDFWVRDKDSEYGLLIRPDGERVEDVSVTVGGNHSNATEKAPIVRLVSHTDLLSQRQWIANWRLMLPYLNANKGLVPAELLAEMEQTINRPIQFGTLEKRFQVWDLVLARTAVFLLLHQGKVCAPSLYEQPLGPRTLITVPE